MLSDHLSPEKQLAKAERRARRWESDCIKTTQELLQVRRDLKAAENRCEMEAEGLAMFREMWRDEKAKAERVQKVIDELGALHPVNDSEAEVQGAFVMALRAALNPEGTR